jgi:hypothetical protein
MLFKKCTMAWHTIFYKNHLTSVISSPNFLFCSFLPILSWISNLIDLYGFSILRLSQLLFVFFLLGYWCVVSWKGGRNGITKFMRIRCIKVGWDATDFGSGLPSASFAFSRDESIHVIFYLNRILVVTHFHRGGYCKAPSCIVILLLELKEFL